MYDQKIAVDIRDILDITDDNDMRPKTQTNFETMQMTGFLRL